MKQEDVFKDKKVLVTGGAGFIGTNLLLKLLPTGAKIRATFHKKQPQIKDRIIEFVKADLTKTSDCKKVVQGVDLVFMCAANTSGAAVIEKTPLVHVTPNVLMNTLMMETSYAAGVQKFLFISSNTVYPLTNFAVKETDVTYDLYEKYFPVAWMKLFGEKVAQMYATKIKTPMATVVVRPGNVYGPFDDFEWATSHVIPALVRKVIERHDPLEVWGDGKDLKDFIYIEDLAEGLMKAMEKVENFDIFNLGGGKSVTIRQVLKILLDKDKFKNSNVIFDASKPTMIPKRLINVSKAKKILGFSPKTSMEDGLTKTIRWYKNTKIKL